MKIYGLSYITLVAPCWLSAQAVQECIENSLWLKSFMALSYILAYSNGFVVITPALMTYLRLRSILLNPGRTEFLPALPPTASLQEIGACMRIEDVGQPKNKGN